MKSSIMHGKKERRNNWNKSRIHQVKMRDVFTGCQCCSHRAFTTSKAGIAGHAYGLYVPGAASQSAQPRFRYPPGELNPTHSVPLASHSASNLARH